MLQSENIPKWSLWCINLTWPCSCFRWIHSGCHWKCQSLDETCMVSRSTGMRSTSTRKEVYLPGWLLLGQYLGTISSVSVTKWTGWVKVAANDMWVPLWMTIPQASQSCQELLKCCCKSERGCANALKPNCRVQRCAIALGCATENEQQNVGCIWTDLRIACIINNIPVNLC